MSIYNSCLYPYCFWNHFPESRGVYLTIVYFLFSQSSFIISLNNIKGNNKKNKTILTRLFSIFITIYYTISKVHKNNFNKPNITRPKAIHII